MHFLAYEPALAWLKSIDGDVVGPVRDTWAHYRLTAGAQGFSRAAWIHVGASREEIFAAAVGAINALAAETNVEALFQNREFRHGHRPRVFFGRRPAKADSVGEE